VSRAWLRRQILRREWSAAELARRTGVSPTSVSRWLNGREIPSSDNARRIADAFYIDRDDVLARAGHRDPDDPFSPDDPISRLCRKLRQIRQSPDRLMTIDAILDTYLSTDRESQNNLLAPAAA
jgi:transcriptional regulator with XRE-family HTH domain